MHKNCENDTLHYWLFKLKKKFIYYRSTQKLLYEKFIAENWKLNRTLTIYIWIQNNRPCFSIICGYFEINLQKYYYHRKHWPETEYKQMRSFERTVIQILLQDRWHKIRYNGQHNSWAWSLTIRFSFKFNIQNGHRNIWTSWWSSFIWIEEN